MTVIIELALNGATPRSANPHVPRTPDEIAEVALRGIERGAAIVHNPNDEPMFAAFPMSVGVANIHIFAHRLKSKPSFVTAAHSGEGFVELTNLLLASRLPTTIIADTDR